MNKAFSSPEPQRNHSKGFNLFKISLVIFTFCLFIGGIAYSVLAKPYNCIPCKENNYCIKGIRYECPLDKPVTQGNRQTSEAGCMTCNERNGNETNPVYDITRDDCVSCYEYNRSTPIWNGNACVACEDNEIYDATNGVCVYNSPIFNEEYIAISNAIDLAKIGTTYPLDGKYYLSADIDLANVSWEPIGFSTGRFVGVFDGNNHKIKNLSMVRKEYCDEEMGLEPCFYVGLFSIVGETGLIKNLGIEDVYITADSYSGGLAGVNEGIIENCYVKGSISGNEGIGLFVGENKNTISKSYAIGTVYAGVQNNGGLVGQNSGTIDTSFTNVSLPNGDFCIGGLVGYNFFDGSISNCYTSGTVGSSNTYGSGGLLGCSETDKNVHHTYSLCSVYGEEDVFGLVNFTGAVASFYDSGKSGISCVETYCLDYIKTTSEMQTPQTFIDAGWDTAIWELIQGQYPKLKGIGGQ